MQVIPAIDLRYGRCVRLYQGDYAQETVFSDDPVSVALQWQSLGAPSLHIVDLDGAAAGQVRNLEVIEKIATAVLIPTQLGGGIRDMETIEQVLKRGVERVILGTAAVETPDLINEACQRFQESIIVSIDAQGGRISTHGWLQETDVVATELARKMERRGIKRFIYTDINRDGTLTEPNFSAIIEMAEATRMPLIAAGGISSLTHIKILKKLGVEGAIIGRALYTGDINLKRAIAAAE